MKYLKLINKRKLALLLVLLVLSSLNGILLSGIIVYAGKLGDSSTINEVIKFGMVSILGWSVVYLANYYLDVIENSVIKDINIQVKQNYFRHEYLSSSNNKDYSSIISVLSNDLKLIEENYFRQIFEITSSLFLLVISLTFMLYLNFWISVMFIVLSILPIVVPVFMKIILSNSANVYSARNAEYIHTIKEIFSGFTVLRSYSIINEIIRLADNKLLALEESAFKLRKSEVFAKLITVLIAGVSFLLPLVVGCYFVIYHKNLVFSELIAIFLANDKVLGPIQSIAYSLNMINTTKDLRDMYLNDFIETQKYVLQNEDKQFISGVDEIYFENVVYNISQENKLKLDLNFKIPFRILITGDSGTGKTTILNLINGVTQPTRGSIKLLSKGVETERRIPIVDQNPFIFDTTLRNNITLFQSKDFSDSQIISVLKKVNLLEELGENNILDYQCGENGDNLSGGQKQRIALARALIRHSKVYLFDEITSNLDIGNANSIHDSLFNLGVSFVEISHHFSLDDSRYTNIYRLENGELIKIK